MDPTAKPVRARLRDWMASNGWTQVKLAEFLCVTQGAVSQWLGKGRPDDTRRDVLEKLTGIEADAWLSRREREKRRDLQRRAASVASSLAH